jgi:hypothetical protein
MRCLSAHARNLPAAKTLQDLQRPALHFAGCIIHGLEERYHVSSSDLRKDSNTECEVMMDALDRVSEFCKGTGAQFPQNLFVQADNCAREMKNQYVLRFGVALLLLCNAMTSITFNFLRVGHTHEDIGAPEMLTSTVLSCAACGSVSLELSAP